MGIASEQVQGQYKKVAILVNDWLEIHSGETFDLDMICRQLSLLEREHRKYVAIELARKVSQQKLEKNNRLYRVIDNTIKIINWWDADVGKSFAIKWPYGRNDDSRFGFDGHVVISPGDLIVVAGGSNFGKSAFCHNIVWENMDTHKCTLMGNEYTPAKFKRRVSRMTWANPMNGDGKPKFELIERYNNWKDIIRPDNINIIDWINLSDKFYQIGEILEGLKAKTDKGITVAILQKDPSKKLGLGGGFGEHLASLYLTIDYQQMTVIKAKEWVDHNPNGEMYGFDIINAGTKFNRIRKIKKCHRCWATGKSRGEACEECNGTGYVDDN